MDKEKVFEKDESCEFPGTCNFGELCQRALVINQELRYVSDKLVDDLRDLKVVVDEAACEHPDALAAVDSAQPVLLKKE